MWLIVISLASAADPPFPLPLSHEERWTRVDRRASHTGRMGGYLLAAGFAQAALGTLVIAYGQDRGSEDLAMAGTVLVTTGAVSASIGIPLTLTGSMRAARSMNERGVHAPNHAGVGAWTCYGLSMFILPAPVTLPVSVVLGIVQMDVNRRVRERAGLRRVRPVGATLTITPGVGRASRHDRAPEG